MLLRSLLRSGQVRQVRFSSSLLWVVEQEGGHITSSSWNTLTAAKRLGSPIHAVVTGTNAQKTQDELNGLVDRITIAENADHGQAEVLAPLIHSLAATNASHVLFNNTAWGKDVAPRTAALLDVQPISEVTGIEAPDVFTRPIYAGNALAKVRSKDKVKVLTIRSTAFPPSTAEKKGESAISIIDASSLLGDSVRIPEWIGEEVNAKGGGRPELTDAKRIVSGGRALQSGDNFQILYQLADKLGAAVGASRAAVDAGYVENALQIGQTGKIVAPELYIAVGISGAIQHLAGMKDSKVIVAINKDADAPIFQIADYGLVGDLFKLVPELTEKV